MWMLGGAALAWPIALRADPGTTPVVGFLNAGSSGEWRSRVAALRQGLADTGHVEGVNVAIEYRWGEGQNHRLPALAADLVRRGVAVIAATGGADSAAAAKQATSTIPIVFVSGGDPVKFGLVSSLNRPGGNVTGVSLFTAALVAKRLALLHELAPDVGAVGMLVNPHNLLAEENTSDIEASARSLGERPIILRAATQFDLDAAFATFVREGAVALVVAADPSFEVWRDRIVALAARHRVPTIYANREFVVAGGLLSYGTNFNGAFRQAGVYIGRILRGEKPAELPVLQPATFELVVNLKTAEALGLTIPPALLARADEVIE
jgi:ABC-type uncharacterized transport system substrate-binding protein